MPTCMLIQNWIARSKTCISFANSHRIWPKRQQSITKGGASVDFAELKSLNHSIVSFLCRFNAIFGRIGLVIMEHAHKEMSASDRDRVLAELELLEVLLRVLDPRVHSKQYIKSNGSSSTLNAVYAKLLHTALVTYSVVTIVPGLPSTDHWPTDALRDQYYQLMLGSSSRANVDLTNIRSELRNVYPKNTMPKYEFVSPRYTRIGIPKDANQSIHILFFPIYQRSFQICKES